ncbi:MAG TPA: Maf family protein [Candidatus Binatia bacterium]|nr:Maf family protein [Candidatus Binatia bacterium]
MRAVLVLASASPRRHQLLGWLGIAYEVDAADIDERAEPGEEAPTLVARLARAKAAAVGARRTAAWVLGADTMVEIDGAMLGKPADAREAADMLARLAGREHRVATGFALLGPGGRMRAEDVVVTRVRFRPLDAETIRRYVASGEPDGKAGGYAIQGFGAGLIDRIDGSFTNVIGLPLVEVCRALEEAGLLGA